MNKLQRICILSCVAISTLGIAKTHSFTTSEKKAVSNKIARLIRRSDPSINVGIDIREANTGRIVFQRNASRYYKPASNLKVLTAVAGIDFLGPNYRYQTSLLTDGHIKNHTLNGNLYIKFSGDPTLTTSNLKNLFVALKKKGVTNISGNLYVDNTVFDSNNIGPGWMWDELRFCYAAPVNGVIINHNCMPFQIYPDKKLGRKAHVSMPSDYQYIQVNNDVTTVHHSKQASCPLEMNVTENNQLSLSGCLAPGKYKTSLEAAAKNINVYVAALLKRIIQSSNISLKGHIATNHTSKQLKTLVTHNSNTLASFVKTMLKKSDNVIANALYKTIGASYYHNAASWSESQKAELALLHKYTGMPADEVTAVDGAGLSRYSQITPNALAKVLTGAYKGKYFSTLYNDLPISGMDGTLKYRMGSKSMLGKVHAKTGSMTGVKTLAGYVKTRHHDTLAFVILVNGFSGSSYKYRRLQDNIVTYLASL